MLQSIAITIGKTKGIAILYKRWNTFVNIVHNITKYFNKYWQNQKVLQNFRNSVIIFVNMLHNITKYCNNVFEKQKVLQYVVMISIAKPKVVQYFFKQWYNLCFVWHQYKVENKSILIKI